MKITVLCCFLAYINVNVSLQPPTTSHPSRLSESTGLNSTSQTAIPTGYLFSYVSVYVSMLTLHFSPSLLPNHTPHKSVLYVCISIVAL